MQYSASPQNFVVRSQFATTGLTCTPATAGQVRQLMEPYLAIDGGSADSEAWWMIAADPPFEGLVRESVEAQGEIPVHYAVDPARRNLYHLAPENQAWVTQSLLRATRAAHRSAASAQGALFLHAGLVRIGGLGIALVGGSRSGKTSLIMASVLNGAGTMVCNDDVSLIGHPGRPGATGTGWPRSVSVRLDTLDLLFGRRRAEAVRSELTHPANETLPSLRETGVEPHGTALLYPWEYAELLDTKLAERSEVDAIVHLSFSDGLSDSGFSTVLPRERAPLLNRHVLPLPNKHLNIFGHEPAPGDIERTRGALAALPTFRFRYSFRDVSEEADRLVSHLSSAI